MEELPESTRMLLDTAPIWGVVVAWILNAVLFRSRRGP